MIHALGGDYMDSILNTIKKMIGLDSSYTQFDTDIIILINSAIAVLRQVGVGPQSGFVVTGDSETWSRLMLDNDKLESVKTYIYLRVRRLFDPPSSSALVQAIDSEIKELEWRLNITVDSGE